MQAPQVSCHKPFKFLCFKLSGCGFELQEITFATAWTHNRLRSCSWRLQPALEGSQRQAQGFGGLLTLAAALDCHTCTLAEG